MLEIIRLTRLLNIVIWHKPSCDTIMPLIFSSHRVFGQVLASNLDLFRFNQNAKFGPINLELGLYWSKKVYGKKNCHALARSFLF